MNRESYPANKEKDNLLTRVLSDQRGNRRSGEKRDQYCRDNTCRLYGNRIGQWVSDE